MVRNVSAILSMCFHWSFSSLGLSVMVLRMFSSLDRLKSRPEALGLHIQQWLIGFPSVFCLWRRPEQPGLHDILLTGTEQ